MLEICTSYLSAEKYSFCVMQGGYFQAGLFFTSL